MKKIVSNFFILCALLLVAGVWHAPAFGKASKTTSTVNERPNAHPAQGTGNWKAKKDKHQKAGPQNEKKKKTFKWLRLKK